MDLIILPPLKKHSPTNSFPNSSISTWSDCPSCSPGPVPTATSLADLLHWAISPSFAKSRCYLVSNRPEGYSLGPKRPAIVVAVVVGHREYSGDGTDSMRTLCLRRDRSLVASTEYSIAAAAAVLTEWVPDSIEYLEYTA